MFRSRGMWHKKQQQQCEASGVSVPFLGCSPSARFESGFGVFRLAVRLPGLVDGTADVSAFKLIRVLYRAALATKPPLLDSIFAGVAVDAGSARYVASESHLNLSQPLMEEMAQTNLINHHKVAVAGCWSELRAVHIVSSQNQEL